MKTRTKRYKRKQDRPKNRNINQLTKRTDRSTRTSCERARSRTATTLHAAPCGAVHSSTALAVHASLGHQTSDRHNSVHGGRALQNVHTSPEMRAATVHFLLLEAHTARSPNILNAVGQAELRVDLEGQVFQQGVFQSCRELRSLRLHRLQSLAGEHLYDSVRV